MFARSVSALALAISASAFAAASRSPNTIKAYQFAFDGYAKWCDENGVQKIPADPPLLSVYLADMAKRGMKVSTIRLALTAIAEAHRAAGLPLDCRDRVLQAVWKGIRRQVGIRPERKAALLGSDLRKILEGLDRNSVSGCRNAALLLMGFGGALRRSEVVGLNVEDITISGRGMKILIRKSKTDSESAGQEIGIHFGTRDETCVVSAYQAWLQKSGITSGAVFRRVFPDNRIGKDRLSLRAIGDILKGCVEKVGLNPDEFGSHSLRAGFATSAALAGCNLTTIMKQTRHKSVNEVKNYVRDAEMWEDNATRLLL